MPKRRRLVLPCNTASQIVEDRDFNVTFPLCECVRACVLHKYEYFALSAVSVPRDEVRLNPDVEQ
jgi:hypothetical protein